MKILQVKPIITHCIMHQEFASTKLANKQNKAWNNLQQDLKYNLEHTYVPI